MSAMHIDSDHDALDLALDVSLPLLDDSQTHTQTPSASSALSASPCNLSPRSMTASPSPSSNVSLSSFHFDANTASKMATDSNTSSSSNTAYRSYSDIARGESAANVHKAMTHFSHKADTPSPPQSHITDYLHVHNHHDNEDDDDGDEEMKEQVSSTQQQEEEEERREFRFSIENDHNLRDIINHNLGDTQTRELGLNSLSTVNFAASVEELNHNELTSEYILSKLYNYMKISEMSKYGISVFEVTFSSYLPYLTESDIYKLATSYWCNGEHFERMIAHRGDRLKCTPSCMVIQEEQEEQDVAINAYDYDERTNQHHCTKHGPRLQLKINEDLLDAAMQSGACVDKIESMLLQKRVDEGVEIAVNCNKAQQHSSSYKAKKFYHTASESNFYLRNLKHRFWNHEVLVRVFIQNGWLTPNLAETAMKTFIKTIYHRVLDSKLSFITNCNKSNQQRHSHRNGKHKNIKFSENFLHSFFVSYFCLDDIPKMYKQEIRQKMKDNHHCNHKYVSPPLNEETLRRWCELIELLASRGANVHEAEFCKVIPLQYALQLGKNTYRFISSSHAHKNEQLIPYSYYQQNISVPDDIWDILVSYL